MTEQEIQKQILNYLEAIGIFHWRNNVGRKKNLHFGLKGSADILGITIKPTITPKDTGIIDDYSSISDDAQSRIDKAVSREVQEMQKDIEDAEYYASEDYAKQELKIELINLVERLVNEGKGELIKIELNKLNSK